MSVTSVRWLAALAVYAGTFVATAAFGGLAYFHFANPRQTCASCHEMANTHANWSASAHRSIACRQCHGGALTLDVHALGAHVRRVARHFSGPSGQPVRLHETQVLALHQSCQSCHPQVFADWQASRHSTNFARLFLDPKHNAVEPPTDDCLRCHGLFVDGSIASVVTTTGAAAGWTLKEPGRAAVPAIPCLTCHQIHARTGETQVASFYFRRERTHVPANRLPVVAVRRGESSIRVSRDPRQRVCVQCHAPAAAHQLGTSDDRTTAGVHEGLSCRDCHWSHTNSAQASCKACHPADSHCGLDVEKMDTSFVSSASRHNVHTVSCVDCHAAGVPRPKSLPSKS